MNALTQAKFINRLKPYLWRPTHHKKYWPKIWSQAGPKDSMGPKTSGWYIRKLQHTNIDQQQLERTFWQKQLARMSKYVHVCPYMVPCGQSLTNMVVQFHPKIYSLNLILGSESFKDISPRLSTFTYLHFMHLAWLSHNYKMLEILNLTMNTYFW